MEINTDYCAFGKRKLNKRAIKKRIKMHATQITTNSRKHVIMGQTFYIQEKEMVAPRLHDIRG